MSLDKKFDKELRTILDKEFSNVYDVQKVPMVSGDDLYKIIAVKRYQKPDAVQLRIPFEEYKNDRR